MNKSILVSALTVFFCLVLSIFSCDEKKDTIISPILKEEKIDFHLNGKIINNAQNIDTENEIDNELLSIESDYIDISFDHSINLAKYKIQITKENYTENTNIGINTFCYGSCIVSEDKSKFIFDLSEVKNIADDEKMHISYIFDENTKKGVYKLKVSLLKDDKEVYHFFISYNIKKDINVENNNETPKLDKIVLETSGTNTMSLTKGIYDWFFLIRNSSKNTFNDKVSLIARKVEDDREVLLSELQNIRIEPAKSEKLDFKKVDINDLGVGNYILLLRYNGVIGDENSTSELKICTLQVKDKKKEEVEVKKIVTLGTTEIKNISLAKGVYDLSFSISNVSDTNFDDSLELIARNGNENIKLSTNNFKILAYNKANIDYRQIDLRNLVNANYKLYLIYRKEQNLETSKSELLVANLEVQKDADTSESDDDKPLSKETDENPETTIIFTAFTGQQCGPCTSLKKSGAWDVLHEDRFQNRVLKVSLYPYLSTNLLSSEAWSYFSETKARGIPSNFIDNKVKIGRPHEASLNYNLSSKKRKIVSKLSVNRTINKIDYSFYAQKVKGESIENEKSLRVLFWLVEKEVNAFQVSMGYINHDNVFLGTIDGKLWGTELEFGKKIKASSNDFLSKAKGTGTNLYLLAIVIDNNTKEFIDAVKVDI